MPKKPLVGIGGIPLVYEQLTEAELDALANYKPSLTYGQAKQAPPEDFLPAHVAWDKKVLRFVGYFKQTVNESAKEYFRVRPVDIYYYLEDDSISVVEPVVENSGMPQGKLIKRQRLPKDDFGNHWHWKDLNNGQSFTFYGKNFRITNCDLFTKNFLESEGIVVELPEQIPKDPYIEQRTEAMALRTYKTPSSFDKLKQFIELDGKVLRFYAVWDDRDNMFGEIRPVIIHYYLVDDTLEVREVHEQNDGRDPFPVLIQRHKVPINRNDVPASFPAIVLELSEQEIKRHFNPRDFMLGQTCMIYGRRFLIYDMDNFTKAFYYKNFNITDFPTIEVEGKPKTLPKMEMAPYDGLGSIEDSLQSCKSLVPQPPKKDFVKMLENDHRVLRFEATMDSFKAEDNGRRFIISFHLSDDMMAIYEPPIRNSGIIGGKFLEKTRVGKPGSTVDKPLYYTPDDFKIGAIIQIFSHRFKVTNADEFVLNYMENNSSQFSAETIASLKEKIEGEKTTRDILKGGSVKLNRSEGDRDVLVKEIKGQLKKMSIVDKHRMDEMFLRYDTARQGYIDIAQLADMCHKLQLPADEDIMQAICDECGTNGKINLEEFRQFFEG